MLRKAPWWFVLIGFVAVLGVTWVISVQTVNAQCGTGSSSCRTCHETQKQGPVTGNAPWHGGQHASFDCTTCHLGSKIAADKTTAHTGTLIKLADQQVTCKTCHTADWQTKMQSYSAILAAGGGKSSGTNDPLGGYIGTNPAGPSPASPSSNPSSSPSTDPVRNWILIGVILVITAGGGTYIYNNERKLRIQNANGQPPSPSLEDNLMPIISPDQAALLPGLSSLSPEAVEALGVLFEDPDQAEKVFIALAEMDEETYQRVCDQICHGKTVQTGR